MSDYEEDTTSAPIIVKHYSKHVHKTVNNQTMSDAGKKGAADREKSGAVININFGSVGAFGGSGSVFIFNQPPSNQQVELPDMDQVKKLVVPVVNAVCGGGITIDMLETALRNVDETDKQSQPGQTGSGQSKKKDQPKP